MTTTRFLRAAIALTAFLLLLIAAALMATSASAQTDWRVARNGVLPTRPAYPLTATGTRSPTAAGRATVGDVCNCTSPVVEGRSTYCAAPTLLAVCARPAPATTPPVEIIFNVPPPGSMFRVPPGWSDMSFTSSSDSPDVPPICARAGARPHVATLTGTHPSGPFTYTICETDGGGIVGWWRINPRSSIPLGDK